jgi:hypothetical protein
MVLQDASELWGMHTSTEGEVFDPLEAEEAALWDIDDVEVERLRAAPEVSQGEAEGALHTPGSHLTGEEWGGGGVIAGGGGGGAYGIWFMLSAS